MNAAPRTPRRSLPSSQQKPSVPWSRRNAAHLLWRTGFGATHDEIDEATAAGPERTLARLLSPQPEGGAFQTSEGLLRQTARDTGNIADLKAWWLYRMLHSANPLAEKMTLFWHNHFATSNQKVQSVRHMGAQNDLIRRHALGSFRDLLHGMARDVAMLVWLDGNANRKRHPNENFAREVMELFSLGEGNYTERDIVEAARAFTGWHVREDVFWFNRLQHDFETKEIFGRSGNFDGDDVIDLCLAHDACPRFLAGKLLRFFVKPAPSAKEIDALAGRIRAHDYQMAPVLAELLSAESFYESDVRHALIKSPVDLVLGAERTLSAQANLQSTAALLAELGQELFEPPTVKGWEGDRLWISSATLLQRANFATELVEGTRLGTIADPAAVANRNDWSRAEPIVDYYVELLLARDLESGAIDRLETFLRQTRGDRSRRIRALIRLLMTLPEFQLF